MFNKTLYILSNGATINLCKPHFKRREKLILDQFNTLFSNLSSRKNIISLNEASNSKRSKFKKVNKEKR